MKNKNKQFELLNMKCHRNHKSPFRSELRKLKNTKFVVCGYNCVLRSSLNSTDDIIVFLLLLHIITQTRVRQFQLFFVVFSFEMWILISKQKSLSKINGITSEPAINDSKFIRSVCLPVWSANFITHSKQLFFFFHFSIMADY